MSAAGGHAPGGSATSAGAGAGRFRLIAAALLALAVPMAYVVLRPAGGRGLLARGPGSRWPTTSMYDHSRWALVAALVLAALVVFGRRRYAAAGLVAAACVSARLVATGLYGWKHARPYTGISGNPAWVPRLRILALVLAVAALVALALCLWGLIASRMLELHHSPSGRSGVIAGSVVALLLPVGSGLDSAETRDLTSVVAYVLVFSLPWGCALAACDLLPARLAATSAAVTCASAIGCLLLWPMRSYQFVVTSGGDRPTLVVVALIAGWLTWRSSSPGNSDRRRGRMSLTPSG